VSTSAPEIGAVVDGRYEVLARIARGGMATVYRAHDRRLDRTVALKVMHPHLAESEAFIARFRREARAAAKLTSPHIVAVYDQGLWGDSLYLTMEFVDGEDLRDRLNRVGALSLGDALHITEGVLSALATAHRRGVIHRDIKPENVLLTADDEPKVADFGLARAISDATAASTGTVLGTVAYLAPELVTHGEASPASDVYAAGVMLYELLVGRQPFVGELPINVAFQHVNSDVPSPSLAQDWIPAEVDQLVAALTARDASERLPDGDSALRQLRLVLLRLSPETLALRADVPGPEPDPDGATAPLDVRPSSGTVSLPAGELPEPSAKTPRRSRRRPALLALLLVLLVGGGAAAWYFLAGPGSYFAMPTVVSLDASDGTAILKDHGLKVELQYEFDDTAPAEQIMSTDPDAGAQVRAGSAVVVVVSKGIERHDLPDVVGLSQSEALAQLEVFDSVSVQEAYSQTVPAGDVISVTLAADTTAADGTVIAADTAPEAGTSLAHTAQLVVTASLGREPIEVPDVTGQALDDALRALEEAGAEGQEAAERVFDDGVPEGSVVSQDVVGAALRGDTVTVTVSKGPELFEVPDVTFMSYEEAKAVLEEAGFTVERADVWGGYVGIVRFQSVDPGEMKPRGTTITLSVV